MPIKFQFLIEKVKNEDLDIGSACLSVTKERKEQIDFTIPFDVSKLVIVVRKDSKITSLAQLNGKTVGSIFASTSDDFIRKTGIHQEQYTEPEELIQDLEKKKLEAAILDNRPAQALIKQKKDLQCLPTPVQMEDIAFGVSKQHPE